MRLRPSVGICGAHFDILYKLSSYTGNQSPGTHQNEFIFKNVQEYMGPTWHF